MSLEKYKQKRDFSKTEEPVGGKGKRKTLSFVVQRHHATSLHYDFRLEMEGVLKSWAVPKGPSLNPADKRLAMMVEDHPFDYGKFEGEIPAGNYGAGVVSIFDAGTYTALDKGTENDLLKGLHDGSLKIKLNGKILKGEFALVRMKTSEQNAWLLIKHKDEYAVTKKFNIEDLVSKEVKKKGLDFKRKKKEPRKPEVEPDDALAYTSVKTKVKLISRNGIDFSSRYKPIVEALAGIKAEAVIDGELVIEDALPKFYVFDLLSLNNHDIRDMDLLKRKALLFELIKKLDHPLIIYSKHERADKEEEDVVQEQEGEEIESRKETAVMETDREEQYGKKIVKLTNLNKLYWPVEKISKGQLIDYYKGVSEYILPHLKDKPLSLNRHPNGIAEPSFFQKDLDREKIPSWIKTAPLYSDSTEKTIDYLVCNDEATLLWMVNLGCIEINPWLSSYKKPEVPLFAVLDLDPHDVDFNEVIAVAKTAKMLLDQMNITAFIKTSGSKGLHIFIPVSPIYDYDITKEFIHYVGQMVFERHPNTTSLERSPAKRKERIYLDFLQNRVGQTIAAPYSVRPKPGATVSAPLAWDELKAGLTTKGFTLFNMGQRLHERGDLWKDMHLVKNNLKKALTL
ncbi:non-homologous end-joining DNA ligase [Pedobacter nyackensis]|uniref:DNA ligase D n=1 Tax=Pedobacter nyackensis TaxID=475255 RepID=A0A1W2EXN8_9SPHI|nr:non-homologous end-joining DNA ligase [Pedobacter nyackensis]SMD14473.1 DNA ligase D [Pedobacter nyackensis]